MANGHGRGSREICEVWAWNFDAEFGELLAASARCGDGAILALDTEFPGFLREESQSAGRAQRYQALRENVDNLRPIQLGVALAQKDGTHLGTWSFNLRFDVEVDLHTEASVNFLSAAGLDFQRHASEGIDPAVIGRRLAASPLVGRHGSRPCWLTFQGEYDLGYLLKLLTSWPLPSEVTAFDLALAAFCPRRRELRDALPKGSLDSLIRDRGIERVGMPHTAGSDALATLELFMLESGRRTVSDEKLAAPLSRSPPVLTPAFSEDSGDSDEGACLLDDARALTAGGCHGWSASGLGSDKVNGYPGHHPSVNDASLIVAAQLVLHGPGENQGSYDDGSIAFPAAWDNAEGSMESGFEDGYWNLQDMNSYGDYTYEADFMLKATQPVQATQPLLQTLPPGANSHFIGWSTAVTSGAGAPLSTYVATAGSDVAGSGGFFLRV
eukprot:TRINITY_DN1993_c2_g1_i3.p1 TRINITY_DN1993_c2_g1~~TRINITY_DN1993_c2_g1_i3.p1  ORF type:complete len:440 (+),score=88.80 TRINITY_DN1993_c2_g1_i3:148-1467(+)